MKIKAFRYLDRATRKEIIEQNGKRCCRCGRAHELVYIEVCKVDQNDDYILLCTDCIEKIAQESKEQKAREAAYKKSISAAGNKRLFNVYHNMIQRCHNPNHPNYKNYGGRGISVCKEWRESFKSFCLWAKSAGYDDSLPRGICTIDRINNDGNYEPSNCRWVDMKIQCNNRRKRKEI